jgi:8-oxo-dGTP pyrophosphatase MutT (NUDIX family)
MIPSDPMYGGSSPQIPKGGIDEGDSIKYTAVKECCEECGLIPLNLASVEEFKIYPTMKMAVFIGTVHDPDNFVEPHWESKWSGWVSYNNERDKLRDIHKHIFDDIYQHVSKLKD